MIGWYPVHRQRLPDKASSMAARVGLCPWATVFMYSAKRLITKPGVQKPHWLAWQSTMACCTGCSTPFLPSAISARRGRSCAVNTTAWAAEPANRMQLFTARQRTVAVGSQELAVWYSAITTVQAPQSPEAQPSLTEQLPDCSRSHCSRVCVGDEEGTGCVIAQSYLRPLLEDNILRALPEAFHAQGTQVFLTLGNG
nr:hypothetical protein NCPCFENI_00941 [Cupriavidus sp.]